MEEFPDIVQVLKTQLRRIFLLCNLVILFAFLVLLIQMDFRIISRTVFGIAFWILFLLMDASIIMLYFKLSRPIKLFSDEWKSKEGELDRETLEYYWNSLTKLPFRMGIWIAIVITLILTTGAISFYFMGLYDLRQSMMMFFASFWLGVFSGMALYTRTKATLNPALALIHGRQPFPWGGKRMNFPFKMIAIVLLISVFPLLEMSLQVERWSNESVKKFYRDMIISDLEGRAAILRDTIDPSAPLPDFARQSDKYFIMAEDKIRNTADLRVKKWEIPLPEYFTVPVGHGLVLGRKVKPEEWKPYTRKVRFTVILFFSLFSVLAILFGYIFARIVSGSTSNMTVLARHIARGQAFRDQHLISYSDDETGDLSIAFNELLFIVQKQFRRMESLLDRIREAVNVLGSSTGEMRAVADRQLEGAQIQAERVKDLASASAEIAAAAAQITEKSTGVKAAAENTLQSCRDGIKRIENAVGQIIEANKRAEDMVERMGSLENRFADIEKVAETIAGVSDRTELISLNASLEAAGARRHGARFGVVASEVKRLAVMIGDMTVEIRRLLSSLRDALHLTASATRESASAVAEGVAGVTKIHDNLDQLSKTAENTYTSTIEINISTREQTLASKRLAETLIEISELAKQVAIGSEESSKAINEINQLAMNFNDMLWDTDSPS